MARVNSGGSSGLDCDEEFKFVWYKMWYKSRALCSSRMLNPIFIRGLSRVCGGGAVRLFGFR